MKKHQLIQIARVAFPERVKQLIDFKNVRMMHMSGVYRLYDKDEMYYCSIPVNSILTVFIGADNFIQFTCGNKAFNHYAVIEEMKILKLIK